MVYAPAPLVDPTTFLARSVGAATAADGMLLWCPREDLRLLVLWGTPSEQSAGTLVAFMSAEIKPERGRYRSYVDLRRLEAIGSAPFERFLGFMRAHTARFAAQVERSVLVHGGGVTGAAAAGYSRLVGEPFESRAFTDPVEALEWLCPGEDAPTITESLDTMYDRAAREEGLAARARRRLRADLKDVSLQRVAADLGVAPRSLQRDLATAGSTFRLEVRAARIEAAKEALARGEDKLFSIAIDVGFASLQAFSDAFVEATGERPSAYRARLRSE